MRRTLYFVMALALVLGLSQCKKEQPLEPTNEGNVVNITLNVDGGASTGSATGGSRAEVDPPHVNFVEGDTILVASDGKYVGYLVHNGTTFSGGITDPTAGQPLYFYFLGNKIKVSTLTAGTTNECTVNISDQTGYPALPVISMAPSEETYPSDGNVYTASLHNKCSLMKFNVTTPSVAPICFTGMNNEVTVNFMQAASDADNNGFSYGMSAADGGLIKMKGGTGSYTPEAYWAIVLPQGACDPGTATSIGYTGIRPAIHEISMNQYYSEGIDNVIVTTEDQSKTVDFSNIGGNFEIQDGYRVKGQTQPTKKISIADGATVVFDNVTIPTDKMRSWAGVTCNGDATIFLKGDNSVTGSKNSYPGIFIGSGHTLTIQGTGSLTAKCSHSSGTAAGIGGGSSNSQSSCGNIIILGGTVTAIGYGNFAGIGSGGSNNPSCGNITIANTVTQVKATCGSNTTVAIGNPNGTCGTVTFGTQVMYNGTSWTTEPTNDGTYGGLSLAITNSNKTWTLTPVNQ